jgi:hypothetical protein
LYKKPNGEVVVKPLSGNGPGEPTGYNIKTTEKMEEAVAGEFYARLGIYSPTLTIDQISSFIGLKCDRSQTKGDLQRPHGIIHIQNNSWFIFSQLPRDAPLEDHVNNVLERVSSVVDKIRIVADQSGNDVELSCVIHSKDKSPLNFTKETIAAICRMGASIDIDLYFFERSWKVDTGVDPSKQGN